PAGGRRLAPPGDRRLGAVPGVPRARSVQEARTGDRRRRGRRDGRLGRRLVPGHVRAESLGEPGLLRLVAGAAEPLDHVLDVLQLLLQVLAVGLEALDPDVAARKAAPAEAAEAAVPTVSVSLTHMLTSSLEITVIRR